MKNNLDTFPELRGVSALNITGSQCIHHSQLLPTLIPHCLCSSDETRSDEKVKLLHVQLLRVFLLAWCRKAPWLPESLGVKQGEASTPQALLGKPPLFKQSFRSCHKKVISACGSSSAAVPMA